MRMSKLICCDGEMDRDPFKEYLKEAEPDKISRGYAWSTAIGLQAVDGLRPSQYLINTAVQNIEGKISLKEAQNLIDSYYEEKAEDIDDGRIEEADKVSARIAELLSETAFSFTPNEYISIHRRLFQGIYGHAGKIRDYNITKKEWVLDGETVLYGSASELRATLGYDFSQEREFSYKGLSMNEIIHHLAVFVSRLWQIHIFGEGNTRTTEYLELFLRNLLLNEKNELHNRYLHISGLWKMQKVDIGEGKVDIQSSKVDIESLIAVKATGFSEKTISHIYRMYDKFGFDVIFGRTVVGELLGLQNSSASKLLAKLLRAEIIEPVSGHGKGKYRFSRRW